MHHTLDRLDDQLGVQCRQQLDNQLEIVLYYRQLGSLMAVLIGDQFHTQMSDLLSTQFGGLDKVAGLVYETVLFDHPLQANLGDTVQLTPDHTVAYVENAEQIVQDATRVQVRVAE